MAFQLTFPLFHLAEFGGIPGGGVYEREMFCFCGGQFIEREGEGAVIIIHKFRWVFRKWGGETDILQVMEAVIAEGEMDLRFL